ncbi:Glycosyltransferase family 25 (LPS biosynthesis protein), partial [uncultured virus]
VLIVCLIITFALFIPIFISTSNSSTPKAKTIELDTSLNQFYNPYDLQQLDSRCNLSGSQNNQNDLGLEQIYVINIDRYPERYEYVASQLNNLGLTNYQKWIGTDGFYVPDEQLLNLGISSELAHRRGLAGCAASHIRLWRHIVENKLGWVLILEDDAHFHPDFVRLFGTYMSQMTNINNALMIFPGYCGNEDIEEIEKSETPIINEPVMCLHGYMISHIGAKYLLDNLLPMKEPVDITIIKHFRETKLRGCYAFNGNVIVDGIRPHDYKEKNGARCQFSGIIYQNQRDRGSTIHKPEIVYEHK